MNSIRAKNTLKIAAAQYLEHIEQRIQQPIYSCPDNNSRSGDDYQKFYHGIFLLFPVRKFSKRVKKAANSFYRLIDDSKFTAAPRF
jgi:hypothetical protein